MDSEINELLAHGVKAKAELFENVINHTLEEIKKILLIKGKEYRRGGNPYHNFEKGAQFTGTTREEVLQGFVLKHLISVDDLREDIKKGIVPLPEVINEKYNDILVYFLIEKASMLDRISTIRDNPEFFKKIVRW